MSKIPIAAVLGDIHWMTRTPEYRKETCPFQEVTAAKLTVLADYCRKHDIPAFVAGDTFDISRSFNDWWTMREFLKTVFWPEGKEPVRLWVVPGQHDRFHHNAQDKMTSLNALLSETKNIQLVPSTGIVIGHSDGLGFVGPCVYGAGWGDQIPIVRDNARENILVTHKSLWHQKPVYPGQTEGNVAVEAKKFRELGYDMVFSGDNHRQFDVTVSGVEIHNVGCFTRDDVSYRNQQPRFLVLFDDMSIESVFVGEKDVFDLERSDADKGRDGQKDEFSEALAGGYEHGTRFKGSLEKIAAEGKCGELTFTDNQRNLLRDIINSI